MTAALSPLLSWPAGRPSRAGQDLGTSRFLSNFTSRLDQKGRVSVPAPFRAVLTRDGFEGLYVHPALVAPALDAGGHTLLNEIDSFLSTLPPYSDERDHLSTALLGTSEILKLDPEGRVILTESAKAHAGITEAATFVGLGHKFQIWEPQAFLAHLAQARVRVRELKQRLGSRVVETSANSRTGARDR